MKKSIIIVLSVFIFIGVVVFSGFFMANKNKPMPDNLFEIADEEIVNILNKNSDIQSYIEKNKDFKIEQKEVLTKESIIEGQKGQDFQAVYYGLSLENNRYIKVNLINQIGDKGFVAVIDLKDNSVPKAFGILLFQANANQNGQIPIPTENK